MTRTLASMRRDTDGTTKKPRPADDNTDWLDDLAEYLEDAATVAKFTLSPRHYR